MESVEDQEYNGKTKEGYEKMNKKNELVIFETADNAIKLEVPVEGETVWLTQEQMSELFDTARSSIAYHIGNIFKEEEVDKILLSKFSTEVQMRLVHQNTTTSMLLSQLDTVSNPNEALNFVNGQTLF